MVKWYDLGLQNCCQSACKEYILQILFLITDTENSPDIIVTGDPGDMIFGTYLMGLCLLDTQLASKKDPNPNPLFMNLESNWRIFADYMVYKVKQCMVKVCSKRFGN